MYLRKDYIIEDVCLINFVNLSLEEKKMILGWRNHDMVRIWMYSSHIISFEEHLSFIEGLKNDNKNFYWLVRDKAGLDLGVVYLNNVDLNNKNAYLGIYANPNNEKLKVGKILIESLKVLAFKIWNLHTLKLEVVNLNKRAIRFYKNAGFEKEGILREFLYIDSMWHNIEIMGIINSSR